MEPYEIMADIRANISDTQIVDELVQYMSTEELADFTDTLMRAFDLGYDELDESINTKDTHKLYESIMRSVSKTVRKHLEM